MSNSLIASSTPTEPVTGTLNIPFNDYATCVNLNPNFNKQNQFIYASQLYGTFFAIFARFLTEWSLDSDNHYESEVFIKKITFSIINYRGPINIGIERVLYDTSNNVFYLHVKGLAPTNVEHTLSFPSNTALNCKWGDELVFQRRLDKMKSGAPNHTVQNVFDSEFYDRDGIQKIPRLRIHELTKEQIKKILENPVNKEWFEAQGNFHLGDIYKSIDEFKYLKKNQNDGDNDFGVESPTPRCVPSLAYITF